MNILSNFHFIKNLVEISCYDRVEISSYDFTLFSSMHSYKFVGEKNYIT